VLRYTDFVTIKIATADYRALVALRYRIRLFLSEGEAAARRLGLEPQQYSLLLAVRASRMVRKRQSKRWRSG
jgi:hypothetical protein